MVHHLKNRHFIWSQANELLKLSNTTNRLNIDAGSPLVPPRQNSGDWGQCLQKNFSAYAYKVEGNRHIERIKF